MHKTPHKAKKRAFAPLAALLLLFALTGCQNATLGDDTKFTAGDFNIYQNGRSVLQLDSTEGGSFWYTMADEYGLDTRDVETSRGIKLGMTDDQLAQQYGDLLCTINYKSGTMWHTLSEVEYNTYLKCEIYASCYDVSFYSFSVSGRMQEDDEQFANLYASGVKSQLAIYGLSFTVDNGVITEIESYYNTMK